MDNDEIKNVFLEIYYDEVTNPYWKSEGFRHKKENLDCMFNAFREKLTPELQLEFDNLRKTSFELHADACENNFLLAFSFGISCKDLDEA